MKRLAMFAAMTMIAITQCVATETPTAGDKAEKCPPTAYRHQIYYNIGPFFPGDVDNAYFNYLYPNSKNASHVTLSLGYIYMPHPHWGASFEINASMRSCKPHMPENDAIYYVYNHLSPDDDTIEESPFENFFWTISHYSIAPLYQFAVRDFLFQGRLGFGAAHYSSLPLHNQYFRRLHNHDYVERVEYNISNRTHFCLTPEITAIYKFGGLGLSVGVGYSKPFGQIKCDYTRSDFSTGEILEQHATKVNTRGQFYFNFGFVICFGRRCDCSEPWKVNKKKRQPKPKKKKFSL